MRRLALVVSTPVASGDFAIAADLALAARARHIDVAMFFMDAVVTGLVTCSARLAELADSGCDLVVCASSAEQCRATPTELPQLGFGSQDDHAAIVHKADRVVAFT